MFYQSYLIADSGFALGFNYNKFRYTVIRQVIKLNKGEVGRSTR